MHSDLRHRAALRVLGISQHDIEDVEETELSVDILDINKDLAKLRQQKQREKRQLLREQVQDTAATLTDDMVEQILAVYGSQHSKSRERLPSEPSRALSSSHVQDTLRKEQKKIEAFKDEKKKELQRTMSEEVMKKSQATDRLKKAADEKKRLDDLHNLKLNRSASGAAERTKRQQVRQDAMKKAIQMRQDEMEDLGKRMDQAEARVGEQLARRDGERQARSKEMDNKGQAALARKTGWEDDQYSLALSRVQNRSERECSLNDRLQDRDRVREHSTGESRKRFLEKMVKVQEKTCKADTDRAEAYMQSLQHKEKVRLQHTVNLDAASKHMKAKTEKGELMVRKNQGDEYGAGAGGALPERRKEMLSKSLSKIEHKTQCRQDYLDATQQRRQLNNDMATDMVKDNLRRLERKNKYASSQTLARIQSNNMRVDNLLDMRKQVLHARVNAQRDHMIERHRMEQAFDMIKDSSSPTKVNALLKAMNIPIAGAGQSGEAEEEKDKKK